MVRQMEGSYEGSIWNDAEGVNERKNNNHAVLDIQKKCEKKLASHYGSGTEQSTSASSHSKFVSRKMSKAKALLKVRVWLEDGR
ncbi:hypothetical protein MKW98_018237 [Papaver atlanticum]|uniref:Uncharacterized protein n=1 Tax=Papaver atlanticum TaxID=357466 RepID=A0AAD4X943_9MAGN|nr:hypothetical protein MKW98_018237 [Papaver atlanticum]